MKRRKQFHTPEEIRAHLSNHKRSGLTVDAYCTKANIATSTFWNWRKKYRPDITALPKVPFLRLPVAPAPGTSVFEVILPNNIHIKVPSGFDRKTLEALIAVVR